MGAAPHLYVAPRATERNIRTAIQRLTRLTNSFTEKWQNLKALPALYFAYYHSCRIGSSIRCTRAMEAGLTSMIWT